MCAKPHAAVQLFVAFFWDNSAGYAAMPGWRLFNLNYTNALRAFNPDLQNALHAGMAPLELGPLPHLQDSVAVIG